MTHSVSFGNFQGTEPRAPPPGETSSPISLFATCLLRINSCLEVGAQGPFPKESCSPAVPVSSLTAERGRMVWEGSASLREQLRSNC